MSDMIDEALEKFRNTKERKAEGVVDGQLMKRRSGNAASIETDFNYYVDQYDLDELDE